MAKIKRTQTFAVRVSKEELKSFREAIERLAVEDENIRETLKRLLGIK